MARLTAKFAGLMWDKSFPMLRRLFDAVVLPTVSYGCEIWAPTCVRALKPEVKHMTDIQVAFFCDLGLISRLRSLMQFWMGSHYMPVEQGRFVTCTSVFAAPFGLYVWI